MIGTNMVDNAYAHPVMSAFRDAHPLRGPLGKTYPVSGAGKAVVKGIERRARRVMYPGLIRGLFLIRSAMPRLTEAAVAHEDGAGLIRELNAAGTDSPAKAETALAEQLSGDR